MALTAGDRSEALRIVDDVLAVEPGFEPAVELRDLLDTPGQSARAARAGRSRPGSLRPQTHRRAPRSPRAELRRDHYLRRASRNSSVDGRPASAARCGWRRGWLGSPLGYRRPAQARELSHRAAPAYRPRGARDLARVLAGRSVSRVGAHRRQRAPVEPRFGRRGSDESAPRSFHRRGRILARWKHARHLRPRQYRQVVGPRLAPAEAMLSGG